AALESDVDGDGPWTTRMSRAIDARAVTDLESAHVVGALAAGVGRESARVAQNRSVGTGRATVIRPVFVGEQSCVVTDRTRVGVDHIVRDRVHRVDAPRPRAEAQVIDARISDRTGDRT